MALTSTSMGNNQVEQPKEKLISEVRYDAEGKGYLYVFPVEEGKEIPKPVKRAFNKPIKEEVKDGKN